MTFDEVKVLLASVAVLDNRNVDVTTVQMWEAVLGPFTLAEAMWALRDFAQNNTTDYLRPSHLVATIRRKRTEYAAVNPARQGRAPEAWLAFEAQVEAARQQMKELRGSARLAVEAMEDDDGE